MMTCSSATGFSCSISPDAPRLATPAAPSAYYRWKAQVDRMLATRVRPLHRRRLGRGARCEFGRFDRCRHCGRQLGSWPPGVPLDGGGRDARLGIYDADDMWSDASVLVRSSVWRCPAACNRSPERWAVAARSALGVSPERSVITGWSTTSSGFL